VSDREGRVGNRFRLIYLKSTGLEKPQSNEFYPSYERTPPLFEGDIPETFSSQILLKQASEDLEHPDPNVRILAVQYLERQDPSVAIPLLQEILLDPDPKVRIQALSSLGKFRHPNTSPLLKKCLKDSDPRVRMAALRGIFRCAERIDLNILLQFLSDESLWVRRKVATLLGWTQVKGAFPILMELSKDQDPEVRKAALFSLITLYPEESESRLVEAMTDSAPDLRRWARRTLEKMATRSFKGRTNLIENRS
jgi:HEAT repeat protein